MSFIYCDCCDSPVAELRGDLLIVRAKHHGRRHTTLVSLAELVAKVQEEKDSSLVATPLRPVS